MTELSSIPLNGVILAFEALSTYCFYLSNPRRILVWQWLASRLNEFFRGKTRRKPILIDNFAIEEEAHMKGFISKKFAVIGIVIRGYLNARLVVATGLTEDSHYSPPLFILLSR